MTYTNMYTHLVAAFVRLTLSSQPSQPSGQSVGLTTTADPEVGGGMVTC